MDRRSILYAFANVRQGQDWIPLKRRRLLADSVFASQKKNTTLRSSVSKFDTVLNRKKIMGTDIGKGLLRYSGAVCLILLVLGFQDSVDGRLLSISKPHPDKAAATARWLVSQNFWGILSTISSDLQGAPFGNVVSFSDGEPQKGSGIPYFYLTTLDPTAKDALKNEKASFTVSEYPIGTCGKIDPENPTCAKLTLTGKLKVVDRMSKEVEYAQNALFSKHPEMKHWPKNHHFQFFKLHIENIFLIDWFGGPKPVSLEQYFDPNLNELVSVI